jgi:hypothetical protein
MISIGKHMDEHDIAQEVRFERKVHKGSFLLLEGSTDIKRFEPLIDGQKCSVVNCYGRKNAIEAIKLLYDDGFPGALGVVDADFDRITGEIDLHEGSVMPLAVTHLTNSRREGRMIPPLCRLWHNRVAGAGKPPAAPTCGQVM